MRSLNIKTLQDTDSMIRISKYQDIRGQFSILEMFPSKSWKERRCLEHFRFDEAFLTKLGLASGLLLESRFCLRWNFNNNFLRNFLTKKCVNSVWEFELMLHRWNASIAKRILSKVWLFVNTKWTLWSGHGRRKCFSKMLFVTATVPGFTFSTSCCPRREEKLFELIFSKKSSMLPIFRRKSAENPVKYLIKYFSVNTALPNSIVWVKTTNLAQKLCTNKLLWNQNCRFSTNYW